MPPTQGVIPGVRVSSREPQGSRHFEVSTRGSKAAEVRRGRHRRRRDGGDDLFGDDDLGEPLRMPKLPFAARRAMDSREEAGSPSRRPEEGIHTLVRLATVSPRDNVRLGAGHGGLFVGAGASGKASGPLRMDRLFVSPQALGLGLHAALAAGAPLAPEKVYNAARWRGLAQGSKSMPQGPGGHSFGAEEFVALGCSEEMIATPALGSCRKGTSDEEEGSAYDDELSPRAEEELSPRAYVCGGGCRFLPLQGRCDGTSDAPRPASREPSGDAMTGLASFLNTADDKVLQYILSPTGPPDAKRGATTSPRPLAVACAEAAPALAADAAAGEARSAEPAEAGARQSGEPPTAKRSLNGSFPMSL